ncbi:MAG: hypothetical protein ACI4JS_10830 [Oscillospiraceae bacterium]
MKFILTEGKTPLTGDCGAFEGHSENKHQFREEKRRPKFGRR